MVSEHVFPGIMLTVRDMASQVEGMEARMESLQSGFRKELDELHSTLQQLNPDEIMGDD